MDTTTWPRVEVRTLTGGFGGRQRRWGEWCTVAVVKEIRAAKAPTGECSHCGTYICKTCEKMHLGDATKACPGDGVPVPREVR